ncbi:MAG: hypothetical protein AAF984_09395 [Verrucomicrobiota bacterium]
MKKLKNIVICNIFATFSFGFADTANFSNNFFEDKIWDDGLAEVTVYDALEVRYQLPRNTVVKHFLVKENFSSQSMVKADDWREKEAYEVIKLNQLIHVPTGTYRYEQMHSSFWERKTGQLIKFSLASIDSCGNSYKEGRILGNNLSYKAMTYWQGMDDVQKQMKLEEKVLFYDELPLKLRTLNWKDGHEFNGKLIPTIVTSKADSLLVEEAKIALRKKNKVWQVTVSTKFGKDVFLYAQKSPYLLLEWQRRDGGFLKQRKSVRIPYWQLNKPEDKSVLE